MPHSILVVDDDADILDALCEILDEEGYEVRGANNGAAALEAVRAREPDVMLLDIMMPKMDGPQVVQHLRAEFPDAKTRVVLISANPNLPAIAESLGIEYFVAKPPELDELLETVALVCGD